MPVKKFKDPFEQGLKQPSLEAETPGSRLVKSARKAVQTHLGTPNLPLPAPTPEGPSPYTVRQTTSLIPTPGPSTTQIQTSSGGPGKYNKDKLKDSWNSLSGQTMEYLLEVDPKIGESRLKTLLRETKLKDIGVLLGISTEKVLLMEGHIAPTMGQDEKRKLDEFLPEILKEIQRRGATIQMTERKAEVKLNGK